jgi:hypothetical protein
MSRKKVEINPVILCGCGCGSELMKFDSSNRPRKHLPGHHVRNKGLRRFWSRVVKTESCWLWTGAKTSAGYGQVRIDGVTVFAHRFAYESSRGTTSLDILHSCDNPSCVNPDHLRPGTHLENMHDAVSRGRVSGKTKITKEDVSKIRSLAKTRTTQSEIAKAFGTSQPYIGRIIRGERRRDVSII